MFDKVSGIRIKGGFYENESNFNSILSQRMNIVFGRNGSGKSSIARAFAEQKKQGAHSYELSFTGTAPLPDVAGKGIFVFNEDFIDANVKIDKIRSIVMFGKNIQLDGAIMAAREELGRLKTSYDSELQKAKDLNNEADKQKGKIEDELRNGYIKHLSDLEGKQKNLTSRIFNDIVNFKSDDKAVSLGDYAKDLETRISEYLGCVEGERIPSMAPAAFADFSAVNSLLSRTVKPAELTEEENSILAVLSGELASENYIGKTGEIILEKDRDFCPLCHQGISHEHRALLTRRLLRFKDKQVDDFKEEINDTLSRIVHVEVGVPAMPVGMDSALLGILADAVSDLNLFIDDVKTALRGKYENPYAPAALIDEDRYNALCKEVTDAVEKINGAISEYNGKITRVKDLRKLIDSKNMQLAYWESEMSISGYLDAVRKADESRAAAESVKAEMDTKEREIRHMQEQTDKIGAAMNRINAYLRIIFGKDRLMLESAGNDRYSIHSRGCEVSPKSLSVGERNAIALAYFFACVVENRNEDYDYSEPTFLVLDDPVSSFDIENKAGMISLLGQQCARILKGCAASKVLILTHDFMTLRDLCRVREMLANSTLHLEKKEWEMYHELQNGKLLGRETKDIRENNDYYHRLIGIYNYAKSKSPEADANDANMGSMLRRVLEQYAAFRYQASWYELFNDSMLKDLDPSKKIAIQALYMRPVLNPESHGTEEVYGSGDIQRVARMVLAYLYLADRPHLSSYIKEEDRLLKIAGWAAEL